MIGQGFEDRARWLDRVQSRLVLPAARTLYLIGAGLCCLVAVIGVLIALFFQVQAWRTAPFKPVPAEQANQPGAMGFGSLDQRLAPPTNVRFVVAESVLASPLEENAVIGHFEADTPNGLADFPNGVQIIGGQDSEFFDTSGGPQTVLRAKAPLIAQINASVSNSQAQKSRAFTLSVLARDVFGSRTNPVDVNFILIYGPPTPGAPAGGSAGLPAKLQAIAVAIAGIADSSRATPTYFDAYREALAEPERCGAKGDDPFLDNYGRALEHARPRLTANTLRPFYLGVCDAWHDELRRASDATAASAAQRAQIMAENAAAQAQTAGLRLIAGAARNAALLFVGGAVVAFMTVALFLAFLAIEGHSNAVRQAIELLAAERGRPGRHSGASEISGAAAE